MNRGRALPPTPAQIALEEERVRAEIQAIERQLKELEGSDVIGHLVREISSYRISAYDRENELKSRLSQSQTKIRFLEKRLMFCQYSAE